MRKNILFFFIVEVAGMLVMNFTGLASTVSKSSDTLKILTYNVRNCKGLDDVTDYERVAKIISRIDADFVALQELDSVTERSKKVDVLKELTEKTGMFSVYRASISFQGGKYGIGILTREKPLRTESVPLPGSEEKRSLLMVEMKDVVICCTHFSLSPDDRMKSVGIINQLMLKYTKPVILAGDLNAEPDSPEMVKLEEGWKILNNTVVPTIPAYKPVNCIDFVMAFKSKKYRFDVIDRKVEKEPVASDHLPVWVKVLVSSN
jgi:endonuclease/exonuclease/phosphatase family metal-dependent hydrolase